MAFPRVVLAGLVFLFYFLPTMGQEVSSDHRPRLLLHGEVGNQASLGYLPPSSAFGLSTEIPMGKSWEFQANALYSPDRKAITNDGQSLKLDSSAIRFFNKRMGFIGGVNRSWLWTSQVNKTSWHPSAGVVIRNSYFGVGRLYLTYVFPTGCVWTTPGNPCSLQSNRLQGFEIRQEARGTPHARWGYRAGFYHFCSQANPNEPQFGRNCHWAVTVLALLRFEFHLGKLRGPINRAGDSSDYY